MLEAKDLQAIRGVVEDVLETRDLQTIRGVVEDAIDERVPGIVDTIIDKRVPEIVDTIIEKKVPGIVDDIVDKRVTESENLILKYVDDTRDILENEIVQLRQNVDELNQYYRIHKLENENGTLYLQLINELRKDIEELKQKTA